MTDKKKRKLFIFIMIIIICSLFIPVKGLAIYHIPDHKLLWTKKMDVGEIFTFAYIHSVSKTPIQEILEIGPDQKILVKEVHYIDQGGAGMPEYTWGDEIFENKDGKFIIKNFSREFAEINLTIQPEFEDQLIFDMEKVDLDQLINGKGNVQLRIDPIPVWKYSILRLKNKFREVR